MEKHHFFALVYDRLASPDDDSTIPDLASLLWRCLCHAAFYPFAEEIVDCEACRLNISRFWQAVWTLDTTAADDTFDKELWGPGPRSEDWQQFTRLAVPAAGHRIERVTVTPTDGWRPPDILERMARIIYCGLPRDPWRHRGPSPGPHLDELCGRLRSFASATNVPEIRVEIE